MSDTSITKLGMPKWGLSMTEGKLVEWLVAEGVELSTGDEVAEVETEKINGVVEAPTAGVLRRRVAAVGDVVPVGGLLGVVADPAVPDAEIDDFITEFQASFVPEAEEGEAGPATESVTLRGRTIRYLKQGEGGDALVLLHGFGGDLNNWLFTMSLAGDERTLYALDFPGHGGSTKDVGSGALDELVGTVTEFLDSQGLDRLHLVGHSLGGAVAIALALRHPERVGSLVLVASAGLGEEINRDYVEGFIAAENRRELKPVLQLLFADESLVTRQLVDDVLKFKRVDGVQQALRALADNLFPDGRQANVLAPELERLSVPVLAIWGSDDRIIPAGHAEAISGRGRVEVLPGKGHSPHMEAAGDVNRLIAEFVSAG